MAIYCPEGDEIPANRGTYALLWFCPRSRKMRIGRLGAHLVPRGWLVYVGSAFGPGGLRARCRRHLLPLRRRHWHIDYLRPAASLQEIWFTGDSVPKEHRWAEIIGDLPGASAPIPRFGSSDCRCGTHLFHFSPRPSISFFQGLALNGLPGDGPITAFRTAAARQARRNAL